MLVAATQATLSTLWKERLLIGERQPVQEASWFSVYQIGIASPSSTTRQGTVVMPAQKPFRPPVRQRQLLFGKPIFRGDKDRWGIQ